MLFVRTITILAAFVLVAPSLPLSAQEPASIMGSWQIINASAAEAARDAAIDAVVEDLMFIARPIARRRMSSELPVHRQIQLSGNGSSLRARVGPYDFTTPADGSSHTIEDPWENEVRVTQQLSDGRLRQVFRAENGVLYHDLRMNDAGDRLTLNVRVTSPRLPSDGRYRYTYRRTSN